MANTSSGTLMSPLRYDPLQLHEDPYPLYRRLRDEAPVYRSEERDCWVLSRYEDVRAAARDWESFRNGDGNTLDNTGELFAPAGEVTHADPPIHGRLRDAVRREFGVSMVREQLEPVVRAKVRRLIGDLRGREQVDFAEDLALVLPGGMVCGWLGFPECDHAQLLEWFGTMVQRTPGHVELPTRAFVGRDLMRAYLEDAIAARRGSPRQDLLSTIVGAVEDERLSEDEAIGISMLLFFAGIATTSALIASSLLNLSELKPQLQQLRDAPATIPAAQGITANTVCPGPTDTPALRKFADGAGQDAEKVIAGMIRAVPMKRLGTPDDIGPAVAFLASDEAGFITGQTLSVSGGLTMA